MVIEHLDGNVDNNHYTNLKQSTQKQNIATAIKHGTFGKNHCKKITVQDICTKEIFTFDSVKDLIQFTKIPVKNGSLSCLKRRSKFYKKYIIIEY